MVVELRTSLLVIYLFYFILALTFPWEINILIYIKQ